jgi:GR25 family glycosyltransferase involved in LPS biosynthesis
MKNFVITILDNEKSVAAAERCIQSGYAIGGISIEKFSAITPKTCKEFISENKINDRLFNNSPYSREDNARAAFCSHFSLWKKSIELNENICIFEHDAICTNNINTTLVFKGCVSLGKPSYGKYNNPMSFGVQRLQSKPYFPGAHAYIVNPTGAKALVEKAVLEAQPTDVFLNTKTFPFLEEYYPWPVEVRETFSTIQKTNGCLAKHMYNEDYQIEEVK